MSLCWSFFFFFFFSIYPPDYRNARKGLSRTSSADWLLVEFTDGYTLLRSGACLGHGYAPAIL